MKPKRTILCVDDNEQSLSIRKVMLETRGYRVLAYTDSNLALERFAQGGVDLVLTDLKMPEVDGLEVLAEARKSSPNTVTGSQPVRVTNGRDSLPTSTSTPRTWNGCGVSTTTADHTFGGGTNAAGGSRSRSSAVQSH